MRTWITDSSPQVRSVMIQTIGVDELNALAPLLADWIANEDDLFCRDMAVFAAGKLRAEVCLPAILEPWTRTSRAGGRRDAASYATEDVRPYLAGWFEDAEQPHEVRLQAAWGLGKLGEKRRSTTSPSARRAPRARTKFGARRRSATSTAGRSSGISATSSGRPSASAPSAHATPEKLSGSTVR